MSVLKTIINLWTPDFIRQAYETLSHQDALVHVSIVAELHADPDDARVIHLPVVEGE